MSVVIMTMMMVKSHQMLGKGNRETNIVTVLTVLTARCELQKNDQAILRQCNRCTLADERLSSSKEAVRSF